MLDGESDVNLWQETYGFTFPVLADPSYTGSNAIGLQGGIPHHALIGRDMTVRVFMNQPSGSDIQAALDEEWPDVEYAEPPDLGGTGDDDDEIPDGSGDDDIDGSGSGNPFRDESMGAWSGSVVCAVGSDARAPWLAAALLIPALVWRRRR